MHFSDRLQSTLLHFHTLFQLLVLQLKLCLSSRMSDVSEELTANISLHQQLLMLLLPLMMWSSGDW